MKNWTKGLLAIALSCGAFAVSSASAATIGFSTPTTATDAAGEAVNASASFVTGAGTLSITLQNLLVGQKSVGQNLSDLSFKISTGQTSGSITSSSGLARTVNSNKTYTDGAAVAAGWVLSFPTGGFHLDVLAGTGHAGPAHTILGAPSADNKYDNANGSIKGNGPHNPFLAGSVTFNLNIPGLTSASSIRDVVFSFGTTAGDDVRATNPAVTPVPLPAAVWGGAVLFAGMGLKRLRNRKA